MLVGEAAAKPRPTPRSLHWTPNVNSNEAETAPIYSLFHPLAPERSFHNKWCSRSISGVLRGAERTKRQRTSFAEGRCFTGHAEPPDPGLEASRGICPWLLLLLLYY